MSWFSKLIPAIRTTTPSSSKKVPEGVWTKCPQCDGVLYRPELERNMEVCLKCNHHFRIGARDRLLGLFDGDNIIEIAADIEPADILKFKDTKKYKDRLSAAQKATGEKDALVAMRGTIHSIPVVACAFEYRFIGGSMGVVVGKKFVKAAQAALEHRHPLICFSASGGARMQEALISLFQMAKTSAILNKLHREGIPFISVLTDPTMGGVSASLAMLGDVIIAEPKALIGFAGPRVIEQTVRQILPEGFQRSEFLLENGAIDMIVDRRDMAEKLAHLLAKLTRAPLPTINQGVASSTEQDSTGN